MDSRRGLGRGLWRTPGRAAAATLLIALGAVSTGCAGGARVAEDRRPPPTESGAAPGYRLGAGDVVTVDVRKNPDLSVQVPVRPDGYIAVPLAGDVLAGRRTPAEIAADAERALQRFIRAPQVSITVTELGSAEFQDRVRVVGGVAEPTSVSHRDGMTVVDLVLEAGGVNEFASPDDARLYRTVDGATRAYPIFLDRILKDGIVDTNYPLVPGDLLAIPERRF